MSTTPLFVPSRAARSLATAGIALLVGALVATAGALPAAAALSSPSVGVAETTTDFTVRLTTPAGAPLTTVSAKAVEIDGGGIVPGSTQVVAKAIKGAPGSFVFSKLRAVPYTIEFAPAGTAAKSAFYQLLGGETEYGRATTFVPTAENSSLDVSLASNAPLTGTVVNSKKAGIKKVTVTAHLYVRGEWIAYASAVTDSKGRYAIYDVDPGAYKLEFRTPYGSTYASEFSGDTYSLDNASVIDARLGITTKTTTKLGTGGTIKGIVKLRVRSHTYPLDSVYAVAYPVLGEDFGDYLKDVAHSVTSKASSKKGAWSVVGLAPGKYVVKLVPNFTDVPTKYLTQNGQTRVFTVKGSSTTTAANVGFYLDDPGYVTIQALKNTGGGVKNAKVSVVKSGFNGYVSKGTTNSKGVATLGRVSRGHGKYSNILSRGDYDVVISASGYRTQRFVINVSSSGGSEQVYMTPLSAVAFTKPARIVTPTARLIVGSTFTVSAEVDESWGYTSQQRRLYQWLRDGTPIYGATTDTYTVGPADLGHHVSAKISVQPEGARLAYSIADVGGSDGIIGQAESPVATVNPAITPSGSAGVGDTLTTTSGTWPVAGLRYSFEWLVGGEVRGTGQRYTVTAADAGTDVRSRVTVSRFGFLNGSATSAPVTTLICPAPVAITEPSVRIEGNVYTAVGGTWDVDGVALTYTWQVGGSEIVSPKYVSDAADAGSRIALRIDVTKPGYRSVTRTILVATGTEKPMLQSPPLVSDLATGTLITSPDQRVPIDGTLSLAEVHAEWHYPIASISPDTEEYQWYRDAAPIEGADSVTYSPTAADLGATLSARVSVTAAGFARAEAFADAGVVGPSPVLANHPATVEIAGDAVPGLALSLVVGEWPTEIDSSSIQWFTCADDCATVTPIAGATFDEFTPDDALKGIRILARVTAVREHFADGVAQSEPVLVTPPAALATRAAVSVAASKAEVGTVVHAAPGRYNVASPERTYAWQLCVRTNCALESNWIAARGDATARDYTVVPTDYSYATQLRVVETASAPGYAPISSKSAGIPVSPGTIVLGDEPVITTAPDAFRVASLGSVVPTATPSVTWLVDGLSASYNQQILYRTAQNSTAAVQLMIEYSKPGYATVNRTILLQKGAARDLSYPGLYDGNHQVLTAPDIAWYFPMMARDSVEVTYQWSRGSRVVADATDRTFTLLPSDFGKEVTLRAVARSPFYEDSILVSTVQVESTRSFSDTHVAIEYDGAVTPGTLLTAAATSVPEASRTYTWTRHSGGSDIVVSTGSTYRLTDSDLDSYIDVSVSFRANHYNPASEYSAHVHVVQHDDSAADAHVQLTGGNSVGETVGVDTGAFGAPGDTIEYSWLRDGAVLPEATRSTYELTRRDFGTTISVRVSSHRPGYTVAATQSDAVLVTAGTAPSSKTAPALSGSAVACGKLTASAGTWSRGNLTFHYQWLSGGVAIEGATHSSYVLPAASVGSSIAVTVTAVGAGYADGTATSASTAAVSAKAGC